MAKYDAIIIGAGMSGLAAGIRLAMYDKNVCILEKHVISGGLNSYYRRGKREFDVGLHALTNFAKKGERGKPLGKLLKQLRIPHDALNLSEQHHSEVIFPDHTLTFTNDIEFLKAEIEKLFPTEIDNFNRLLTKIIEFNETDLSNPYQSAKGVVREYIQDDILLEMIFCPLLIYGSAWEDDMDFSQFVIMFKSIFLEGFSRPHGGVRTILNLLLEKFESLGGELRFRAGVKEILHKDGKVSGVLLEKGDILEAEKVISSAGLPETLSLIGEEKQDQNPDIGRLSFTESILVLDKKPQDFDFKTTIAFYNDRPTYHYRRPDDLYDPKSAVVCYPNNFGVDDYDEGMVRITNIAHFDLWKNLERKVYLEEKEKVFANAVDIFKRCSPGYNAEVVFKDVFTPTTIKKYTGHYQGTVYGSTKKMRDGRMNMQGLYICGTDQGFLGIVGAMLSGISMANLHVLQD